MLGPAVPGVGEAGFEGFLVFWFGVEGRGDRGPSLYDRLPARRPWGGPGARLRAVSAPGPRASALERRRDRGWTAGTRSGAPHLPLGPLRSGARRAGDARAAAEVLAGRSVAGRLHGARRAEGGAPGEAGTALVRRGARRRPGVAGARRASVCAEPKAPGPDGDPRPSGSGLLRGRAAQGTRSSSGKYSQGLQYHW